MHIGILKGIRKKQLSNLLAQCSLRSEQYNAISEESSQLDQENYALWMQNLVQEVSDVLLDHYIQHLTLSVTVRDLLYHFEVELNRLKGKSDRLSIIDIYKLIAFCKNTLKHLGEQGLSDALSIFYADDGYEPGHEPLDSPFSSIRELNRVEIQKQDYEEYQKQLHRFDVVKNITTDGFECSAMALIKAINDKISYFRWSKKHCNYHYYALMIDCIHHCCEYPYEPKYWDQLNDFIQNSNKQDPCFLNYRIAASATVYIGTGLMLAGITTLLIMSGPFVPMIFGCFALAAFIIAGISAYLACAAKNTEQSVFIKKGFFDKYQSVPLPFLPSSSLSKEIDDTDGDTSYSDDTLNVLGVS